MIPLTESIAYLAADVSLRHGLAMADAIVYATAKDQDADVVTGDGDLKDLPGVVYVTQWTHGSQTKTNQRERFRQHRNRHRRLFIGGPEPDHVPVRVGDR